MDTKEVPSKPSISGVFAKNENGLSDTPVPMATPVLNPSKM